MFAVVIPVGLKSESKGGITDRVFCTSIPSLASETTKTRKSKKSAENGMESTWI